MNERIQELAEQAKKYALDAMIKITDKEQALRVYSETYDTKFAELIVRECCLILEQTQTALDRHKWPTPSECGVYIKEHFGDKND